MFRSELEELFSKEEISLLINIFPSFYRYVNDEGELEAYFHVEILQDFISMIFDEDRKQEILSLCVEKFPKIIGLEKENIK